MNTIIDAGNTRIKVAHFEKDDLQTLVFLNTLPKVENWLKTNTPARLLISNVGPWPFNTIKLPVNNISLSPNTPLPFMVQYQTPQTLGNDRRGLAAAAVKEYPGKPVLIIDAGTCLTYDFVNEHAVYLGGAIAPGLSMRYKSLPHFTASLPLISTNYESVELIGSSTHDSIKSGVHNGLIAEVERTIERYQSRFKNLVVVFTGGDAEIFAHLTKNGIFARPNFLLTGLNFILEYNA
jgi:type III pantothenate kinase